MAPPEGEAAAVIRETGTGRTVSPDDPETVRAAIRELVELRGRGERWKLPLRESAIAGYSRSALAARLAGMMRQLSKVNRDSTAGLTVRE